MAMTHLSNSTLEGGHPCIRGEGIQISPSEGRGALLCYDGQVDVSLQLKLASESLQNLEFGV